MQPYTRRVLLLSRDLFSFFSFSRLFFLGWRFCSESTAYIGTRGGRLYRSTLWGRVGSSTLFHSKSPGPESCVFASIANQSPDLHSSFFPLYVVFYFFFCSSCQPLGCSPYPLRRASQFGRSRYRQLLYPNSSSPCLFFFLFGRTDTGRPAGQAVRRRRKRRRWDYSAVFKAWK